MGAALAAVKASIIIRAFNEGKHIGRLLDGIQSQKTSFPFEIILVDSGSTDDTRRIAMRYPVQIIEINPKDFTFGYSLNVGIRQARGEICVIVSAHCYPLDNQWIENIVAPFSDPQIGLVYGKQRGNQITKYSEHQIFNRWFPDHNEVREDLPFCNNANSAIRREVWERYPFDETLTALEDLDWGKYVLSKGHLIAYRADAGVVHVHDEKYRQIYRRYYREGLAYKQIFPHEYFGILSFAKFLAINVVFDCLHAFHERRFWQTLGTICRFRSAQFWGTYRAHAYKRGMSANMQRRLYYPTKPKRLPAANARPLHQESEAQL